MKTAPAQHPAFFQPPAFLGVCLCSLFIGWLGCVATLVQAQTARKPSFYENRNKQNLSHQNFLAPAPAPAPAPALRAPASSPQVAPAPAALNCPDSSASLASLPLIANRADFDCLARVYHSGTPFEIPHVLFVIDRQQGDRIYYLNTPRFDLHENFVQAQGWLPTSSLAERATLNAQYERADRRFVFGTLSQQPNKEVAGYTYEFWEGDRLTPSLLLLAERSVRQSFFEAVQFKTNSTLHERVAQQAGVGFITQESLVREQLFLPLNTGKAQGRLRLVPSLTSAAPLLPDDIVVLAEVPIALPPVAGIVTQRPSTLLSHVNLLSKGWRIPNAYVRDALKLLQAYDGQWVELQVTDHNYQLRAIAQPPSTARPKPQLAVRPEVSMRQLMGLDQLGRAYSRHCGSKAANLGALKNSKLPDAVVPDGFCIPFAHYAEFMQSLAISERLAALQQRADFANDAQVRQRELAELRRVIVSATPDGQRSAEWRKRWQTQLQGQGVFVRSSSNSEDLPNFSGAGLYSTVPNVTGADALTQAVQTVWASVYNFEAYEARRAAGIAEGSVVMAVLVQQAVPSDRSGVMITRDPFDSQRPYVTYIAAKRGLGIKVVEGQRIAEQVMYSSWSKAVQVLSRSAEDTQLENDLAGGVRETPLTGTRQVLSDSLVQRLAAVATHIKKTLGNVDQDIEWATTRSSQGEKILVLQARPYVH